MSVKLPWVYLCLSSRVLFFFSVRVSIPFPVDVLSVLQYFPCGLMLVFVMFQGWYIVTYALGIYHLNLFIAFLSPKIDPALDYEGE